MGKSHSAKGRTFFTNCTISSEIIRGSLYLFWKERERKIVFVLNNGARYYILWGSIYLITSVNFTQVYHIELI